MDDGLPAWNHVNYDFRNGLSDVISENRKRERRYKRVVDFRNPGGQYLIRKDDTNASYSNRGDYERRNRANFGQ